MTCSHEKNERMQPFVAFLQSRACGPDGGAHELFARRQPSATVFACCIISLTCRTCAWAAWPACSPVPCHCQSMHPPPSNLRATNIFQRVHFRAINAQAHPDDACLPFVQLRQHAHHRLLHLLLLKQLLRRCPLVLFVHRQSAQQH